MNLNIAEELRNNSYPGRGIIIGKSDDNKNIVIAYFIMGRSENSRNRVFIENGDGIETKAFDESKLIDPSLVIYAPVRILDNATIVTNGDQTDTVYEFLSDGDSFENALRTREFEPDSPNYTPRISGIIDKCGNDFSYKLSILKSNCGNSNSTLRFFYEYECPLAGEGHFIHTYKCDGDPIPSFEGEPKTMEISGNIEEFAKNIWESLNEENKVSLFVRYISLENGNLETKIINKNQ